MFGDPIERRVTKRSRRGGVATVGFNRTRAACVQTNPFDTLHCIFYCTCIVVDWPTYNKHAPKRKRKWHIRRAGPTIRRIYRSMHSYRTNFTLLILNCFFRSITFQHATIAWSSLVFRSVQIYMIKGLPNSGLHVYTCDPGPRQHLDEVCCYETHTTWPLIDYYWPYWIILVYF